MNIINREVDSGSFDWGRTSFNYAKSHDIYPQELYQRIIDRKLCLDGESVPDIGIGTGILPADYCKT